MITAYKYLPGDVRNEERELSLVSKGSRTRSSGLELRKRKISSPAIKKVPCSRARGDSPRRALRRRVAAPETGC